MCLYMCDSVCLQTATEWQLHISSKDKRHAGSPLIYCPGRCYTAQGMTVNALSTPHPTQQPQSRADTNDPLHTFILLLPTFLLYAQFFVSAPDFYSLHLSQICYWLPPQMV